MDKRTKTYKIYSKWVNPYTRAAFVWGLIIGAFVGIIIAEARNTAPNALNQTIVPKVEKVQATTDKYQERGYAYCYNPIICIRDVGEELGVPNQEIITMIKIARCESKCNTKTKKTCIPNNGVEGLGLDPYAKNPNSTATGIFQIVIGTWDGNKCEGERWDFIDNIKCAYKIYKLRGTQPWVSLENCWSK